jgi:hypothetical protein
MSLSSKVALATVQYLTPSMKLDRTRGAPSFWEMTWISVNMV